VFFIGATSFQGVLYPFMELSDLITRLAAFGEFA
jgi:hypothetical protein